MCTDTAGRWFGSDPPINPQRAETLPDAYSEVPRDSELLVVESRLIQRLLDGEGSAWEVFVDRYGGLVRSRVADVAATFGRRGDWSTIDDVTAEVFASLLARDAAALRAFRCRSSLSTYLAVIATRVARRVIGRVACSVAGQASDSRARPLEELPAEPQDPPSVLIGREEKESLLELVDRLPARQRDLVIAFYREEQSYAEISQRFDIPVGSIGTTLRRAEQKLRHWMSDETQ